MQSKYCDKSFSKAQRFKPLFIMGIIRTANSVARLTPRAQAVARILKNGRLLLVPGESLREMGMEPREPFHNIPPRSHEPYMTVSRHTAISL